MLWCRGAGLALQDLHTTHFTLCYTHCITTLHYTHCTLQYTHHILHHHTARVIYQLGGAQLQRDSCTDTTAERQLQRHNCSDTTADTTADTSWGGRNRLVGRTHLHTVTCTSSVRCDSSLLSATLCVVCVVCVVWWWCSCNKIFQLWTLDLKNFIHKHRYKCKCKFNCKYNHNHNHNHNNNV